MAEEHIQRRLAAILAADVVGYSRLMGTDEAGTRARFNAHLHDLIQPAIADHDGRIVKTMGDGLLVEFASVVNAVQCAVAIQTGMVDRNANEVEDRRLDFRIGVNLGDVIIEGDDIHGDGVNIAARLEGLAEPGGLCVSGKVVDEVRNKLDVGFDDMGAREVKNIAEPVHAFRLRLDQEPAAVSQQTPAKPLALPDKPSIAVLPFDNISGDPEQEFFADGLAEDIITALSRNRGFFVIARNSTFTYKGQAVDVTQVGRDLGVHYVLEGSVRKAGSRVRITAQLIDATTGNHTWAERYDRDLADFFAVQDEITDSIVATVAPELFDAEMRRARRKTPQNLDAWECAIRAQWHLARLTKEDMAEAHRFAAEATRLDPGSALGFAVDSFAHNYDASYGWSTSAAQSVLAAHEAAQKAVAADARDAVAQTALGSSELFLGRHDDAINRQQAAIELDPNFAWAYGNLGLALAMSGQGEEAVAPLNEALRLSPRDQFKFLWLMELGYAAFVAERYQEAVDWTVKSIRENPNSVSTHRILAASLGQLNRIEEAKAALAEFLRLVPDATIESNRTQSLMKRPEDKERYLDGLRKAGLPE